MGTPRLPGERPKDARAAILKAIESHWKKHGYSPSVRWIGQQVGLTSTATVQWHLVRLVNEGKIKREPNTPRSIRLVTE